MPRIIKRTSLNYKDQIPDRIYEFVLDKGEEIDRFISAFPEFKTFVGQISAQLPDEDKVNFDLSAIEVNVTFEYFKSK